MKRVQLFPNAITAFGLTCGLFIIFRTLVMDSSLNPEEDLQAIAILFLLAALADLLDGTVARLIKGESEFGVLFDSLSDSITFGVAPAVIALKLLSGHVNDVLVFLLTISSMIFCLCGVLRLVRYSVDALHVKTVDHSANDNSSNDLLNHNKNFIGLPIPAAASVLLSTAVFFSMRNYHEWLYVPLESQAIILSTIMIFLGYLMISRWKFPSVKMLRFPVPTFQLVILTAVLAALLLYGMMKHFPLVFVCTAWAYLSLSCALSLLRFIAGKKSKVLIDFEPDDDTD